MLTTLRNLVAAILPPPAWQIPVLALLGLTTGVGIVVAHQSRAWSYASDDPGACINCHIMMPQYSTWKHSSFTIKIFSGTFVYLSYKVLFKPISF